MTLKVLIAGFLLVCWGQGTFGVLLRGEEREVEERELAATREVEFGFDTTLTYRRKNADTVLCIEKSIADNVGGFGRDYLIQELHQGQSASFGILRDVSYKGVNGEVTLRRENNVQFMWVNGWASRTTFNTSTGGSSQTPSSSFGGGTAGGGHVGYGGWARKQRNLSQLMGTSPTTPKTSLRRKMRKRKGGKNTEKAQFGVKMEVAGATLGKEFGPWMSERLDRQIVQDCRGVRRLKESTFIQR